MVVMPTTTAKNWSATNAGVGNCLPPTGVSYTDAERVSHTGNGSAQQHVNSPVEVILQEIPGKITVISVPPGARIYYDDVDTGMNSSAIISNVIPNVPHNVRLVLSGYQDYIESITIAPGEESRIAGNILAPITPPVGLGSLTVTSTLTSGGQSYPAPGVEFGLYIGGMNIAPVIGVTPVTLYNNIPTGISVCESGLFTQYSGTYTGYIGALGSVIIRAGETTNFNIPLQLFDPNMGMVIIESIPMEANIFIDGLPIGTYTTFMTLMPSGIHTYELRLSGYKPAIGEFTVVAGSGQFTAPTIVSVILELETTNICTWITSKGGWNSLGIFDIMTLVSAYLGQTNLGFAIAIVHIMGGVSYYLNNPSSGDSLTGCSPI